jgi:hypothetical protein
MTPPANPATRFAAPATGAVPARISGGFLDSPALGRVLAVLTGAGHQALVVGGAVRNALLGEPVADLDLGPAR